MSLESQIWASNLPLDATSYTAFRVLLKLANHSHIDGRNAWRSTRSLADEFGIDKRTVQRALAELKAARLITPGDQLLVAHLRSDRRPTVYDLNLQWSKSYGEPDEPLDGVTADVTPNEERGDNLTPYGVTTVVAQGTVIEPPINTSQGEYRRGDKFVTPLWMKCPLNSRTGYHQFGENGACLSGCGRNRDGSLFDPKAGKLVEPPMVLA